MINFIGQIVECIAELSAFESQLQGRKGEILGMPVVREPSELEHQLAKMIELQSRMQVQTENLIEAQSQQFQQMQQFQNQRESDQARSSGATAQTTVKLPKLEILPFCGDILKWKEFWDAFEATIHRNTRLSMVEKFTYLRSKLSGEALNTISGLTLTNENYAVAVRILTDRYGDTQAVINAHYACLMDLPTSSNQIGKLRTLFDTIEKHLRSLEAHGQNINQNVFVSMITCKIPKDVLIQLEIQKGPSESWTVPKLREILNNYVKAREAAERQSSHNQPNQKGKEDFKATSNSTSGFKYYSKTPGRSSAEALVAGDLDDRSKKQKQQWVPNKGCLYCGQIHWSDECSVYPTLEQRKEKIKGHCYICLKKGHTLKACQVNKPCFYCHRSKNHHRSLCPQKFSRPRNESSNLNNEAPFVQITNASEQAMMASSETVVMQTATTEIRNPKSQTTESVRMLMDSGSHRTYITESLAKRLKLKIGKAKEEISLVTFGSEHPQIIKTSTASLEIKLRDGTYMALEVNVVPKITGVIHRVPVNLETCQHWKFLWKDIPLADVLPTEVEASSLDVLVGNDYYLDLILPEKIEVYPGLYLLGSRLGWILAGRTSLLTDDIPETSLLILNFGQQFLSESPMFTMPDSSLPSKPCIEDYWNLETIGIKDPSQETDDDKALENFDQRVAYQNGRYYVTWPWKDDTTQDLPENYGLAYGRYKSLVQRLSKTPDMLKKYDSIIQDQVKNGIIEKVTDGSEVGPIKHYIPHHAVVTPTKTTTKIRVVYDASAKTRKGDKSLNECLYGGPVILHDLCGLLLRFRVFKIGLVADIEKAFLQMGLQNPDRDATRFFWLKDVNIPTIDGNTQIYRFCRVPFGVISSPFLLAATVSFHLRKACSPTAEKVRQNIYVDNVISGCNSIQEACQFYTETKNIFNKASMNLRAWASNSEDLMKEIPEDDCADRGKLKVLGIIWDTQADTLSVSCPDLGSPVSTKREVLKTIASVFDPLGFFNPATLKAKYFLQELWSEKLDWDDLSEEKQRKWKQITKCLQVLSTTQIPRFIGLNSMSQQVQCQLLCFCDDSTQAYTSTVYLHLSTNDDCKTQLVFSKTRLAPLKKISLPRLELMAVVIGVRTLDFVQKELDLSISSRILWTDSQCVLCWIATKKPLTVFVENRLKEIKAHADIHFRYVATGDNPADMATRGQPIETPRPSQLERWWHGPKWLSSPVESWPTWNTDEISRETWEATESEAKGKVLYAASELVVAEGLSRETTPLEINERNFSSHTKLLRVTAWSLRFVNKLRKRSTEKGPLTTQELTNSRILWEQNIQQRYFPDVIDAITKNKRNQLKEQLGVQLDQCGLLRCHGRLTNAELSLGAITPKLLPKADYYTNLVIWSYHKSLLHSGVSQTLAQVRQEYWIPQGRAVVKRVIRNCRMCRRLEGGPYRMHIMPPLPRERVTQSPAFTFTGLDYLGPLYVRDHNEVRKVWVCLFTCLAVRAVRLELVQDMTTQQFLLCIRRFIARQGKPKQIISDNAPQFKLAKSVLDKMWQKVIQHPDVQNYVANEGISWHFITELAPWMGGFYERLVGLVKRSLRKAVGRVLLTCDQLQTFLQEVEAVVNSRPLVYVGDDINSGLTLSPSEFLTMNPKTGIPVTDDDSDPDYQPMPSSKDSLIKMWKKGHKHLDKFWKVWRDDYLLNLRERSQTRVKATRHQSLTEPQVGDVVLIKEDLPRAAWRLGKIHMLIPSRDGEIRTAKVKLPSGNVIGRPLKLLYPIECPEIPDVDKAEQAEAKINPEQIHQRPPLRQAVVEARKRMRLQLM